MDTLTLQPDAADGLDTWIRDDYPNNNYATSTALYVGEWYGGAEVARTLIKFDLSDLPDDAVITKATLYLYFTEDYSNTVRIWRVYRLKRAWVETEATWNVYSSGNSWQTAGGFGADDCEQDDIGSASFTASEALNMFKSISLTPTTKPGLDLGNGWLVKVDAESDDQYGFVSSDHATAAYRPRLVIEYTPAGEAPAVPEVLDFPDWMGTSVIRAKDPDGNYVPVLVDGDGQFYVLLKATADGLTFVPIRTDADGQLIIIPRGESGNYLAVDANGYLTAVLKGVKDGTLTTIRVDADGRLEAFWLDAENQWGDVLQIGSGELAARLGSPRVYDWRGQTFFQTTFENGLPPFVGLVDGSGADVEISPTAFVRGGYSAKLTGGSDGTDRYAQISVIFGLPAVTRAGFSVCFALGSAPESFMVSLDVRKDGALYYGRVQYDWATDKLQRRTGATSYADVATVDLDAGNYFWYYLKLVVDVSTGKWLRVLFVDTEYDLSAYDLYSVASAGVDYARLLVRVKSDSGQNDIMYVDSVVYTVNEPS